MQIRPVILAYHKGKGAIRFSASQPKAVNKGTNEKPFLVAEQGGIFVECANAKGERQYDWDNKIVMAISTSEAAKMLKLSSTNKEVKLFHDPNMKSDKQGQVTKGLNVTVLDNGSVAFNFIEKSGGAEKKASVVLDADQFGETSIYLRFAMGYVWGFSREIV